MAIQIDNAFFKNLLENRIVRFFFSNGVGFILDASVYFLIYRYYYKNHSVTILGRTFSGDIMSLFISYMVNIVCNFLLSKYFVFSESKLSGSKQFFRFAAVAVIGFFANLLLLRFFVLVFHIYAPVARMAAALSLGIASYFVHKFYSFNLKKKKS